MHVNTHQNCSNIVNYKQLESKRQYSTFPNHLPDFQDEPFLRSVPMETEAAYLFRRKVGHSRRREIRTNWLSPDETRSRWRKPDGGGLNRGAIFIGGPPLAALSPRWKSVSTFIKVAGSVEGERLAAVMIRDRWNSFNWHFRVARFLLARCNAPSRVKYVEGLSLRLIATMLAELEWCIRGWTRRTSCINDFAWNFGEWLD